MITVLENLLPKSNQLQIPQTNTGIPIQSEIVDGVLHVWEQTTYVYGVIPDVDVDLDPSKTYCLGFYGEIISGQYSIYGLGREYRNVISDNGVYYITASGETTLEKIHMRVPTSGENGEVYIKSFFLVEGDKPPSIWTPAHANLTPEQIALMKYGEYKEIKSF